MLAFMPFLLVLGRLCLSSAPCVYMQRKRQETSRQAMEGKEVKSIWKGIKWINMISMVSKEARKQANKKKGKQVEKQTKGGVQGGTNVGLDRMSITSLCWSMDDTLASKTHAWTCKQACEDVYEANKWHKQAWWAYHRTERKRGKVCTKQLASRWCNASGYIQTRPHGHQM